MWIAKWRYSESWGYSTRLRLKQLTASISSRTGFSGQRYGTPHRLQWIKGLYETSGQDGCQRGSRWNEEGVRWWDPSPILSLTRIGLDDFLSQIAVEEVCRSLMKTQESSGFECPRRVHRGNAHCVLPSNRLPDFSGLSTDSIRSHETSLHWSHLSGVYAHHLHHPIDDQFHTSTRVYYKNDRTIELDRYLGDIHNDIVDAEAHITRQLEAEILKQEGKSVEGAWMNETGLFHIVSDAMAKLDCLVSLSRCAKEYNYQRSALLASHTDIPQTVIHNGWLHTHTKGS